ncbi:MAG: autotransporter domain-containing protein [Endomicrobiaceae bacterium]|nr:autotransporter domain-containing protein [Endomicrobiaceae bacterium]
MFKKISKKLNDCLVMFFVSMLVFTLFSFVSSAEAFADGQNETIFANTTNLTFFNSKAEHVYDKIRDRSRDVAPCNKIHDRIWAEYYYNNYNVSSDKFSPKYDTVTNGILVGFDIMSSKQRIVGDKPPKEYDIAGNEKIENGFYVDGDETVKQWTLGIMGGYGATDLKQKNDDKSSMKDFNLGFYGGYENKYWLFKGMLLGGYEQYNIDRAQGSSDHDGYSAALDLEAGYKIALTNSRAKHRMYLKPFIGAIGSYANNDEYKENDLKVARYDAITTEARGGLELNGRAKKFGWYAKAGIRQLLTKDYKEVKIVSDDTNYVRSSDNAKTSLTGGIGVDYDISKNWSLFANGLGNFTDKTKSTNYYANIGLAYKFNCKHKDKSAEEAAILQEMLDRKAREAELKRQQEERERLLAEERARAEQEKIQKYEASVVTEVEAKKMKEKTIKSIRLSGTPTFVFGTSNLNDKGKAKLQEVAKELEGYPDATVLIEGHTDSVGNDAFNQKLSEQRASAAAKALKKDYGVKNKIAVIGKGEKEPIASNKTEAGRAQNRRVEIILTTEE